MYVKKISVSLPEDLLNVLDKYAKDEGVSRSKVIAEALRMYLRKYDSRIPKYYPTVLWKIRASGSIKLRSPRKVGRKIRGEWVVEKFKL